TARSALQKLPKDLAYRQFIEARIAEENSDLDSAKTLYSSVVESADKEFAFSSARHLSLLLILGKKWDEATKMLEKAASLAQAEGFLEKDSIEFWSRYVKHRGKLPRSGEPYRYRSVYYWLEEGRKFTKPSEPDLVFPDRLILRRFCPQNSKLLSKELRDRLLALQSYGLYDLIADEVKFALPRSQDEEQMFNRISELSAYGASADAFRDLLSSSLMESAFHRRCMLNAIKALYPVPFMEAFSDAATESGLEVALLLAIARTESAFNPRAWSAKNAMGLMQILPSTAELEGIKASTAAQRNLLLSNPNTSAQLGAAHLKKLITQYEGKWHYAIAAYNAGSTVTNRWKQRFPDAPEELWVELISYKETRDYVKKVMAAYWIYSDLVL
ncbi:MAG: lytic transglycosylase domain-containing protein, partial [Bdellovibrionales bacterium]|nr:lytic transglycosylase domain-containing protein [Bdellovibrionales bacterium]